MIVKTERWILTFYSASGAMAVERFCKTKGLPGRLLPVPREISASCGLAWAVPTEERDRLSEVMKNFPEEIEGAYQVKL